MSFSKGIRSASSRRKPSSSPSHDKKRHSQQTSTSEKKMRSLQSLQERLCFTLKRPRTTRHHNRGGPNSLHRGGYGGGGGLNQAHPHRFSAKSTLMESGLIQIPHLQCEYYESPSPLSISSCISQESVATTTTTTTTTTTSSSSTTASSTITHVSATYSAISPSEYNSSDDGFSCDEVMSLVSCCPDMVMHNVLDFMPCTSPRRPDMCEERGATTTAGRPAAAAAGMCAATSDQAKVEYPLSNGEDDGEPYRIDLCDFEPDVNALNSPPQDGAYHHQKNYGGGVLCLRLDYEEVLRAWKERGECLISREPIYYPSPYLDPLHIFGYTPFVPHPPFF